MRKIILGTICLILASTLFAQDLLYQSLKWEEEPKVHTIPKELKKESAVIIQDNRYIQISNTGYQSYSYYSVHRIIHVIDDAGIEKFNRVYIPMHNNASLLNLKVRTIDEEGEIHNFNDNNLKELENVDGYGDYKIFAIEGLVKGGELEYEYTLQKNVEYYGREIFQTNVPVLSVNFILKYPEGFQFKTKSYNGFSEEMDGTNKKVIIVKDIPAFPEEGLSSYTSNLMRVDYRVTNITYNYYYSNYNVLSWSNISQNLFNKLHVHKHRSSAKRFMRSLDLKDKSEIEKIKILENVFKTEFTIKDSGNDDYEDIDLIFRNKAANELGIAKAYLKCLEVLKIKTQILYTNSRYKGEIDEGFPHYMDLRETLFFFPQHNKYLTPSFKYTRLGDAPSKIAGNNALLIKTDFYIGGLMYYDDYSFTTIDHLPSSKNQIDLEASISLNKTLTEATIEQKDELKGYRAYSYRYLYADEDKREREEFKESLTSSIDDAKYSSFEAENTDVKLNTDNSKVLRFNHTYTTQSIIKKVGNDVLLSIGKIIGEQPSMYEKKERKSNIILYDKKEYNYIITLNIPEGYTCQGLEKLKIKNVLHNENNEVLIQFISDYEVKNNQLIITINEDYNVLELDKKYYNEYRKVINAAADFNNLTIVLRPN